MPKNRTRLTKWTDQQHKQIAALMKLTGMTFNALTERGLEIIADDHGLKFDKTLPTPNNRGDDGKFKKLS